MVVLSSLFSGGDLVGIGAKMAGCELGWTIELNAEIAEVAQHNLKHQVRVESVMLTDFHKLERPNILWASPPCINYSVAKVDRGEQEHDRELAQAIVRAITTLKPPCFILENVEQYRASSALSFIEGALFSLGYWVDRQIVNAADYGVPQTRKRLILRAIRGGFVPPLPAKQDWLGWYDAIADLIPELPETEFAAWQIERLPESLRETALIDTKQTIRNASCRRTDQPALTITAEAMRRPVSTPKAFLVSGLGNQLGNASSLVPVSIRAEDEPSFTTKASDHCRPYRAWLNQGRVVRVTSRALARFQTMPDWYELPPDNRLASTLIGNGVPCELVRRLISDLIPCLEFVSA